MAVGPVGPPRNGGPGKPGPAAAQKPAQPKVQVAQGRALHPKERTTKNRSAFADARPAPRTAGAPVRERKTKNRSAFDAGGSKPGSVTPAARKLLEQVVQAPQRASSASAATATAVASKGSVSSGGARLADKASQALGALREPSIPGNDATHLDLLKYQRDSQRYNELKGFATSVIQTASAWPTPLPNLAASEPAFPGPNATAQELARFQLDFKKFDAAVKNAVAGKPPGPTSNSAAYGLGQEAVRAIGSLTEPAIPGNDATLQQLQQYQRDLQRYSGLKGLATSVINATGGMPNPIPGSLDVPRFPGPDSTPQQLAAFKVELQKFVAAVGGSAGPAGSAPTQPGPATTAAARAFGAAPEPAAPGPHGTYAEFVKFDVDAKKFLAAAKAVHGGKEFGHLLEPKFPGATATPQQLVKYAADMKGFLDAVRKAVSAQLAAAAPKPSLAAPTGPMAAAPAPGIKGQGGTIEDRALAELGNLQEPQFPRGKLGPDGKEESPTEAQLAQFQRDLGKYNRMFEMYSKIMANAHEMKKALIANLPRS